MNRSHVGLFLAIVTIGCTVPMSARMRIVPTAPNPAPDPDAATVVFLRPGGGGANAILDETGKALGEVPTGAKLVVKVAPGKHTFVKTFYSDAAAGDFTINEASATVCNAASGDFEAGKLYFIEASLVKLFAVKPDNPKLAQWAPMPIAEMDPAKAGATSVASSPHWARCFSEAVRKAQEDDPAETTVTPAHAMTRWP